MKYTTLNINKKFAKGDIIVRNDYIAIVCQPSEIYENFRKIMICPKHTQNMEFHFNDKVWNKNSSFRKASKS